METTLIVLFVTFVLVIMLDVLRVGRTARVATLLGIALAGITMGMKTITFSLIANDLFSRFFAVLILGVAFLVVLASKADKAVYYGALLLSTIGMLVAASSKDILLLYVGIELVTAPAYLLIFYGKTKATTEAATKYFVISIVASVFLLLGVGLLAISAGTTTLATMHLSGGLFLLGIVSVLAGLGFKMGIFPFNFWIPDVYQGASPEVAGFLAGASKKAGFAAFMRVLIVLPFIPQWTTIMIILALLTMTIPNIMALLQENARRMLAYSIMTHAGFLLMGIIFISPISWSGTLVHAFTHGFMALGAFLVLGVFRTNKIEQIEQFRGMGWKNPFLGISLTLFLLSLAGIPLMAGFASKLYLFYAVATDGLVWLVVIAILNSALSLFYYFRVIRALYGYDASGRSLKIHEGTKMAIWICLGIVLLLGVLPGPLYRMASWAVTSFF